MRDTGRSCCLGFSITGPLHGYVTRKTYSRHGQRRTETPEPDTFDVFRLCGEKWRRLDCDVFGNEGEESRVGSGDRTESDHKETSSPWMSDFGVPVPVSLGRSFSGSLTRVEG